MTRLLPPPAPPAGDPTPAPTASASADERAQPAARRPSRPGARMTTRAILQFAISGLAALVLLGGGSVLIFQARGEREALRDARQLTRAIGLSMVAPRLSDGIIRGDRDAVDRLHAFVTGRVKTLDDAIVRVKLWGPDGTIVYSDERQLIGSRYPLAAEEREAFRTR